MKKVEAGGKKLDEMAMRSILDDKDIAPKQSEPVKQPETPSAPAAQPPVPASTDVPEPAQTTGTVSQPTPEPTAGTVQVNYGAAEAPKEDDPFKGGQDRPEVTKVILTGDRLRKYFPDVTMAPREIEESVYSALEERRQRQLKEQQAGIFKKSGGASR